MRGRGLIAGLMFLAGCDIDGNTGFDYKDAQPDAFAYDAGTPGLATRGRFQVLEGVDLQPGGAVPFAAIEGRISNGDQRPLYEQRLAEGSCTLLTLVDEPFCLDPCDGVCIGDALCVDWPRYLSAGRTIIDGLLASVVLSRQPDNVYLPADTLPTDLFSSEAVVNLTAEGDEVQWFLMSAGGVRPLNADLPLTPVVLDDAADLVISWPDPDPSTTVVLELYATNAYHGQPYPAILDCHEQDDGQMIVPRQLIAAFPPALATCVDVDCPRARLRRQHADSVIRSEVPVELVVAHEVSFAFEHL